MSSMGLTSGRVTGVEPKLLAAGFHEVFGVLGVDSALMIACMLIGVAMLLD
jgi:hypothetical protein